MKTKIVVCLFLASACFAASNSDRWSVREEETIRKTLTLSGAPMRLLIDNVDGYVHVTGTNGSQVQVTAHKTIRADADSDLQQAKNEVKLTIEEKPGTVSVYYDAPWRCNNCCNDGCREHRRFYNVTYDIDVEVPRAARAVISTVNHGDVRLEGTAGDFDVSNVNGGISMTKVSGSGDVHTVNGPIRVEFARNPAGASSFKSVNGQLDMFFPSALSADLLFKTFNGQIYSDFDVAPRATPIETERKEGRYVYRSNRLQGGRAGQGGPQLSFDTLNGNIRLHRAGQGGGGNE
ncbi:MAG TPA: hypothetical protein VK846_09670 [Candidatus Limnocylindria bacterium]|nr:hypothetical protein [Candidatus Limnocylindria bacterium]